MENEAITKIVGKVEEVLRNELKRHTTLVEEVEYWIDEHGIELDEETKERVIEEMIERIDNLIDEEIDDVVDEARGNIDELG